VGAVAKTQQHNNKKSKRNNNNNNNSVKEKKDDEEEELLCSVAFASFNTREASEDGEPNFLEEIS
jgi:hypothetical protein